MNNITIKDVAKKSGVAIGTVSRVLNDGSVSKKTKDKVLKAMEDLNYVPNDVARNIRTKKTGLIGLMLPNIGHPFFGRVTYTIERELNKMGYKLLLCNSEFEENEEINYIEMLERSRVEGIIVMSHQEVDNILLDINIPIVTIDKYTKGIPCVASDNYKGGQIAAEQLIKSGRKNIAYIGGKPPVKSLARERLNGFLDYLNNINVGCFVYEKTLPLYQEEQLVKKFVSKYGKHYDGIFTSSDMFAASLIYEFKNKGIKVPDDVSVIGFDGIQNTKFFNPILTTIKQNKQDIAKQTVNIMLNLIQNKDEFKCEDITSIPVTFIEGETIKH